MGEEPARYQAAEPQRMILQPTLAHTNAIPQLPNGVGQPHGGADEEPYTIKCICRYDEDDGNTVLCELCDTWQHIDCFYPKKNGVSDDERVPDVHHCIDCRPRQLELDSAGAASLQQHRLENLDVSEGRKGRRVTQKAPKRPKVKELNNIATTAPHHHTNGFAFADHKAGSPKDGGPPPKRSKTSHRSNHSLSITSGSNSNSNSHSLISGSRNRSESNALGAGSPPSKRTRQNRPHDYFSPQLLQIHRTNTTFTPADANNHVDLGIAAQVSNWLDDPAAFAEATNGLTHNDVFQQATTIEGLEVPIRKNVHRIDPPANAGHGIVEIPYLVAEADVVEGQFVGELRGLIGHQDEYKRDPANRWEELKHPQHFVFFHPHMPLYVDCRTEGTMFRNVRRSCDPNLSLNTIVTGARDLRFCLTAKRDIPADSEITIGWDTRAVSGLLSNYRDKRCDEAEMDQLHNFAEGVLSHFGGCACDMQINHACAMEHLDRRLFIVEPGSPDGINNNNHLHGKPPRQNGKKRKGALKKSPGATINNSRASSEAVQTADPDDDDSQSNSRSSKNSRDGSPNRPTSHDGPSAGEELSARERKKLMQQERWFERLAHGEGQPPGKRKKRNSGTQPNLSPVGAAHLSKPLKQRQGNQQADSATMTDGKGVDGDGHIRDGQSPTPFKSRTNSIAPSPSAQAAPSASAVDPPRRQAAFVRPVYADASTQTVDACDSTKAKRPVRRAFAPLSVRLLRRGMERKMAAARDQPKAPSEDIANPVSPSKPSVESEPVDVEMKDVDDINSKTDALNGSTPTTAAPIVLSSGIAAGPTVDVIAQAPTLLPPTKPDPSAPPWPSSNASPSVSSHEPQPSHRPAELHVDLPSKLIPSNTDDSAASPQSATALQSPSASLPTPPIAQMASVSPSPSVLTTVAANVPQQSPAKKKVSLSDYMKRHNKKTPGLEKTQSQAMESSGGTPGLAVQQQGGSSPASASEAKTSSPPPNATD